MIVLDTNVISETLKARPNVRVLAWLDRQNDALALTSITVGELLTGVHQLPLGHRRTGLLAAVEDVLLQWAPCVPYDDHAAQVYAQFREVARHAGRGLSVEDGMIAACCATRGATLATRNTTDFDFLPVPLVNPWREG